MISIPSIDEQRELIKAKIKKTRISIDGEYYAISMVWFKKWKDYVKYDENDEDGEFPGAISNIGIANTYGVKKSMVFKTDFYVLAKDSWKCLHNWYSGGPEIKLDVSYSEKSQKPLVLPYFDKYSFVYNGSRTSVYLSEQHSVGDALAKGCKGFKLDPNSVSIFVDGDNQSLKNMKQSLEVLDNESFCFVLKDKVKYYDNSNVYKTQFTYSTHNTIGKSNNWISPKDSIQVYEQGACGLSNLGNSCYFNSVIQCLIHNESLIHDIEQFLSTKDPSVDLSLSRSLCSLYNDFFSGRYKYVSPSHLFSVIQRIFPIFSGHHQQDALELLLFVLDRLDDETKGSFDNQNENNDSLISKRFRGHFRSHICCLECNHCEDIEESYHCVSLSLPNIKKVQIQIISVPFDPTKEKVKFFISLRGNETIDELTSVLTVNLKIESLVFASGNRIGEFIKWVYSSTDFFSSDSVFVYEIPNKSSYYAIVYLLIKCKGSWWNKSENIIEIPYLIEIPSIETKQDMIERICLDHFSYLWSEKFPSNDIPIFLYNYKRNIAPFDLPNAKIQIILEKSFFSKTMRFKPMEGIQCLAKRKVFCFLNTSFSTTLLFQWHLLSRKVQYITNNQSPLSLQSCIEEFSRETELKGSDKWLCTKCQKKVIASKQMEFISSPPCLVLHLKRFIQIGRYLKKCDSPVDYPLNLSFCGGSYKLKGVVDHFGSLSGGHYTSKAYVESAKKWYSFNDSNAMEISSESAISSSAYILFYEKNI